MSKKSYILLVLSLLVTGCGSGDTSSEPVSVSVYCPVSFSLTQVEDHFDIHTQLQADYIAEYNRNTISSYADGKKELSRPESLEISYSVEGDHDGIYYLEIDEDSNFTSPWEFQSEDGDFEIFNLKVGTKYYYRGCVSVDDVIYYSEPLSFTTAETLVRNLYVSGVTNVRDLGGYEVCGKYEGKVKQGLAYRCARLNATDAKTPRNEITQKGIDTMLDQIGMKTEIDLRLVLTNEIGAITSSPLGDTVSYYNCPMDYNVNLVSGNLASIKDIFDIMSVPENYPLCYHCNIGTDRTGAISYILLGLLGVEEFDIDLDYLFSNFGNIGGSRRTGDSTVVSYRNFIKSFKKDTLQENCEEFLKRIGITQEQIDTICELLIEPY